MSVNPVETVALSGVLCRISAAAEDEWTRRWVDKLPTPVLAELSNDLIALLDEHTGSSHLRYPWSVVRDYLHACHLYVSYNGILIRPIIAPVNTHLPFSNAKQHVYMSATLGEGGELERLFGTEQITRLPVPKGWDRQGVGRRLFLFPERSLDEVQAIETTVAMMKETP